MSNLTYVIRRSRSGFAVGHYEPLTGKFELLALHDGLDDAEEHAQRLNHGPHRPTPAHWFNSGAEEYLR